MATSQFHASGRMVEVVGGGSVLEEALVESVWGFRYSELWMQCLVQMAYFTALTGLAMIVAKFVRFVK